MQEDLTKLVDNISKQEIKLLNINFNANENTSGVFLDKTIESKLVIEIEKIGNGEANSTEKSSKKNIFIFADYKFNLSYHVSKENNIIDIIEMSAQYRVMIFLNDKLENIINEKEEDYYSKMVSNFFDTTGRVMIYPYFRNVSSILARESGYVLPILPPLKIN